MIDTSTNTVVATAPVGVIPVGVAMNPGGTRAYVTNFVSNTVSVIDTSTNTVVATVAVGTGPNNPAVTPDGTRLYVPNGSSNNVSVVNTTTNTVVATVPVGGDPRNLAITPDGTRTYVSNVASGNLSVIDTNPASPAFHTVIATVATATFSRGIAITPNGAFAYVPVGIGIYPGPDQVMVVDTNPASPTFHTVLATITVQSNPWGVAITPDGTRVYVVNIGSNSVSVISTATNTVTATLSGVAGDPQGVAITPDGKRAYVTSTFYVAKVIDTDPASPTFHTVIATVTLGLGPSGIAITPAPPPPVISVAIDIKPGSFPNSINPKSQGKIPVAILSGAGFDAPLQVDQTFLLTFGRTGDEPSLAFCNSSPEDVNGDGLLDLICHFHTLTAAFQSGDTQGILKGKAVSGIPLSGKDSVRIVPPK